MTNHSEKLNAEVKPWKSIEDQISLLKERGMIINDDKIAYNFLYKNNYYRLSGYTLCHRKNDVFFEGFSIEKLIQIYEFDTQLKMYISMILEQVEVTYKSLIAYYHSEEFGPIGYENSYNFSCTNEYSLILSKSIKLKKHYGDNPEVFVKHYVEDKKGKIPLWALIELLNFTEISKFYRALPNSTKIKICKDYLKLPMARAYKYVESWLWCASSLRNICCHRGRLYNRLFTIKPKIPPKQIDGLFKNKDGKAIYNNLFAQIIALKNLYPDKNTWYEFIYNFKELTKEYPDVNIKRYGFPEDWEKKII